MRLVPIKSEAQHEVQALHRVREQLLKSRTALVNQVRDLLAEHGVVAPHGIARARRLLLGILADPARHGLSGLFRETLQEMAERLRFFDERVGAYDDRIERVFKEDERCRRLAKVEGVGPLVATAVVAAVGNASEFKSGQRTICVARVGSAAALERQSQPATRDQQARRSLFAYHPDSRSARCFT
jgi:transposase